MLIAEDVLLLLLDDESGKPVLAAAGSLDQVLAGALLVELSLAGRVALAGEGEATKAGRVVVRDASPTGDALLDESLRRIEGKAGAKPSALIDPLGKGTQGAVVARLVAAGLVTETRHKVLGLFPTTRWPAADGRAEADVRARVAAVLERDHRPDVRTAAVIALLVAANGLSVVTGHLERRDRGAVRRRAKEVSQGDWATGAAKQAIDEAAAVIAAAMVPIFAATVVSGS